MGKMENISALLLLSVTLASTAPSVEPVTESSSSNTTDTEWQDYMESLSTNTTLWEQWGPQHSDYSENDEIDALTCPDGKVLDGEECVLDPANCPDGYLEQDGRCVMDPTNCPTNFEEYDGACESELQGAGFIVLRQCRCRSGYFYSVRRGRCSRCRRRRLGRRDMCGC